MIRNAPHRTWIFALLIAAAALFYLVRPARAFSSDWSRQFGTDVGDVASGISADIFGNVYISGSTLGSLAGQNAGSGDGFVSKYDADGALLWTRQHGTAENDVSTAVAADALGNVFISGITAGDLGGPSAGNLDVFVAKYDANGDLKWTRQLGNTFDDRGLAASADDAGNVYIAGRSFGGLIVPQEAGVDAFVSKFDTDGNLLWTREPRASFWDVIFGVSADGKGSVYVAGQTAGDLAGSSAGWLDGFLIKFDDQGGTIWTKQFGTVGHDEALGVAADDFGNVFVTGRTEGDLGGTNAGEFDAYVRSYDAAGNLRWTTQFGTSGFEESTAIATDGLGNIYVSGFTDGDLGGLNAGPYDAFVSKLDPAGNLLWTKLFGSDSYDVAYAISADGMGNVYFSGTTLGDLGGENQGDNDAFIVKIAIPEPASWLLAACGVAAMTWGRRGLVSRMRDEFASR